MQEVEGIIVSETKYSNTSKILSIITKEYGIIGVMAKGCSRPKSPLRSVTTKLTYGKFIIYYKEKGLSLLKEVSIINYFKNIRTDIDKISYASYLLELTYQVYKQNNDKGIYSILISALLKIEENFSPIDIMNIAELKYLNYLGIAPIIDRCAVCGLTKDIITLSSYKGGYLCKNCHKDEPIVSNKTIKLIRMYSYVDISKISSLKISPEIQNEINIFLDDYYERYSGLYLKSKTFIKNLKQLAY